MDLSRLEAQLSKSKGKLPPVEKWDPDFCGDIDMHIHHDGSWHYMGTPIGRPAMVRLFASVLKREDEQYFLVTPVEKVGIKVDDVPFIVTQWRREDDYLIFSTQTGDEFVVSDNHPVALLEDKVSGDTLPYANVRRNLWARLHQNVFYQLVAEAEEAEHDGQRVARLFSGDYAVILGTL